MTDNTDNDNTCPLCCNDFSPADVAYPIHCPTASCHFNYCSNCIHALLQSYHDGYQTASDGSQQVRVWLQCPQCRGKYQCATAAATADNAVLLTSERVVTAYYDVRSAYTVTQLCKGHPTKPDSDWSASALAQREQYRHSQDLDRVRSAWDCVQRYQQAIQKGSSSSSPVMELPWDLLANILPASASNNNNINHQSSPTFNSAASLTMSSANNNNYTWKDPTLLMGLDELMNDSEQEFVTSLLTNGTVEGLAQAALTLHSILSLAASGGRNPSNRTSSTTSTTTLRSTQPSHNRQQQQHNHRAVLDVHKLRKQYPLPSHMPTCVALPVYDPLVSKPLLKFVPTDKTVTATATTTTTTLTEPSTSATSTTTTTPPCLTIHSVKAAAGRLGLRKGDVVTHVNGEAVETLQDFCQALHWVYANRTDADETVLVVVNATPNVAQALQERAERMKRNR